MNNKAPIEEEEDALSLSDFHLNSDESEAKCSSKDHHHRRSSSTPSDFFEFCNDPISENMAHAEDIIFCGKLVPYKQPYFFDDRILESASDDHDFVNYSRRYCDSLPRVDPTGSNGRASSSLIRGSRSLDSKKSSRNSSLVMRSEASDGHRSFLKGSKPRWCSFMFGPLKLPAEMDLRDMKSRQVGRTPGRMIPGAESRGRVPANRRSTWGDGLLKVLSCKNHPSVAVTASIGLVPQL